MALRDNFDQQTTHQHISPSLIGGRYRLEEQIGEGHSAVTYRARDVVLGRLVALKLLRREFAADHTSLARFAREARAAAAVGHPNVVQIYDYGTHEGQAYLVMPYVAGRTLKQVIVDEGPLTPAAAVLLARQLLRGLGAIHAAGIVHRDVKPQNILVSDDGLARLADFGIARGITDHTITAHGTAVGTAAYMAPEQIRGDSVSAATDLYAIGAVLFELLTGRTPFEFDHPMAVMHAHLQQPPPAPSQFVRGIPPALDAAVLRALAKDPASRYTNAADMASRLEAAIPPHAARRHSGGRSGRISSWLGPLAFVVVALMLVSGALAMALDDKLRDQAANGTHIPDEGPTNRAAALVVASPTATATPRVIRPPVPTEPQRTATAPEPTAPKIEPSATAPQPTATLPPTSAPTPLPTETSAPQIVPVSDVVTPEQEATVAMALQFSAADWQGGYFRGDGEWYGRAWNAVYGAQSANPRATLTFSLPAAPQDSATMTITGLDDEWAGSNPIVITVNGVEIFAAPNPFQSWDGVGQGEQAGWIAIPFPVPAGVLQEGFNEITLSNQAPSANFGTPPYVLVSDALLEITS